MDQSKQQHGRDYRRVLHIPENVHGTIVGVVALIGPVALGPTIALAVVRRFLLAGIPWGSITSSSSSPMGRAIAVGIVGWKGVHSDSSCFLEYSKSFSSLVSFCKSPKGASRRCLSLLCEVPSLEDRQHKKDSTVACSARKPAKLLQLQHTDRVPSSRERGQSAHLNFFGFFVLVCRHTRV